MTSSSSSSEIRKQHPFGVTTERTQDLPTYPISSADLENLLEYSSSLPTGTTKGKVWKCNVGGGGPGFLCEDPPEWMIGQYDGALPNVKLIRINWYRPIEFVKSVIPTRKELAEAPTALELANARGSR
jgi:hypothetical protein